MLCHIRNLSTGAVWLRIDGPRVIIRNKPVKKNKPITNHSNSGKVSGVAIQTTEGTFVKPIPCTHIDVCLEKGIDINEVTKSGWLLENGNFVWR